MAAPPFPSAPWQPEQFCEYKVAKSEISLGAIVSEPAAGCPGAASQPESSVTASATPIATPRTTVLDRCRIRIITAASLRLREATSCPELQSPRAKQTAYFRGFALALGGQPQGPPRRRTLPAKR